MFGKKQSHISLRAVLQLGYDLELKAEALYLDLAQKTADPDVRVACEFLAKEENRHGESLKRILGHWAQLPFAAARELDKAIPETGPLFDSMFNDETIGTDPLSLLNFALEQEKRSVQLYEFFQEQMEKEFMRSHVRFDGYDNRKLEYKLDKLDEMIREENRHVRMIGVLLEAVKDA